MERKDAGHRQWRVDPKSRSMKCVGCREGHGRQNRMSGWPDATKGLNSWRCVEGDREPWGFKAKVT